MHTGGPWSIFLLIRGPWSRKSLKTATTIPYFSTLDDWYIFLGGKLFFSNRTKTFYISHRGAADLNSMRAWCSFGPGGLMATSASPLYIFQTGKVDGFCVSDKASTNGRLHKPFAEINGWSLYGTYVSRTVKEESLFFLRPDFVSRMRLDYIESDQSFTFVI